jgi:Cu(I)/Ag(I) efflux system membrane protein CusA/SilA
MPALNEGSFLLMPTSMPHAGIEQNVDYVKDLDKRLMSIPEVDVAVGKWGRVKSALDPAPVQMFENTINYLPEYILNEDGHRMQFKVDKDDNFVMTDGTTYNPERDGFKKIDSKLLIPEEHGEYFRQWRKEIKSPDDIWKEIVEVTNLPGLTSAPKLQPIQTRLVMLSTGMRAPMGLKVYGPDLESIEKAGLDFERLLKEAPGVVPSSVFYDRAVGAPYIEIKINRSAIARYGMTVNDVQEVLQAAVGGMALTTTVEGRERFPVRLRYPRELRTTPEELKKILVPSMTGTQVPLGELADFNYTRGPQMIRSENTFLNGYVIFDKQPGMAEVDVVENAQRFLKEKLASGELTLAAGVNYKFAGNYEQQLRATKQLAILVPISLIVVFMLLFFQFKTITASSIHFSGVFVAFAGGFIMLWLYGQGWFLNFSLAGVNMRDLFQMHTINLSVAVWVGFIALFGIATDDGVIMGTYIHQVFEERKPSTVFEVREAVVEAGKKRVRPAMMTAAVAIIALLPVLTSTGKGADIMVPMAIPTFGGMILQIMTMFVVPILQSAWRESVVRKQPHSHIEHIEK